MVKWDNPYEAFMTMSATHNKHSNVSYYNYWGK